MAADARGVIQEGDEAGLNGQAVGALDIGAVEGVSLPHFIGMGFGKGQTALVVAVAISFEQFVFPNQASEGVGRDLGPSQHALLDTEPVNSGAVWPVPVDFGQDGIDGLLDGLWGDLARFTLVGTGGVGEGGHAVLLVTAVPSLDGAPGELALAAVLCESGVAELSC